MFNCPTSDIFITQNQGTLCFKSAFNQQWIKFQVSKLIASKGKLLFLLICTFQHLTWGFLDPNIWGAKQGQSQNFASRGEYQTKFHTWIPLTFCTAMESPKFRFWENIQQNVLIKDLKNFKTIYKKFAQNFSKLKFNRILENFRKYKKI